MTRSISLDTRRAHVVIAGPGQWGQQAIDHLLHRVVAHGGLITVIVPRRYESSFKKNKPSYSGWKDKPSVEAVLEELKKSGKPVRYIYDDHVSQLAAELIRHRSSGQYLTVGYVTSGADEHYDLTEFLIRYCERVLVEKPVSKIFSEIGDLGTRSDSEFVELSETAQRKNEWRDSEGTQAKEQDIGEVDWNKSGCTLKVAEHYLFRPGVERALSEAGESGLRAFIDRHRECEHLHYEFRFCEEATRDDPNERLGAYQDGAILDVLAPHGLGPITRILLPALGKADIGEEIDRHLRVESIETWRATKPDGNPHVSVLTETAAKVRGRLDLGNKRSLHLHLCSAKGQSSFDRYLRVVCPAQTCSVLKNRGISPDQLTERFPESIPFEASNKTKILFFGVSLGAAGYTVLDLNPLQQAGRDELFYVEHEGGYLSDQSSGGNSQAANAHAAMLNALLGDEFAREAGEDFNRFVPVKEACAVIRFGLAAQQYALHKARESYTWEKGLDGGELDVDFASASKAAVSFENYPHRLVTVLGPEGSGKTHVVKRLKDWLEENIGVEVKQVETPHYPSEQVDETEVHKFVADRFCRQLAGELDKAIPAGHAPAKALLEVLVYNQNRAKAKARVEGKRAEGRAVKLSKVLLLNRLDQIDDSVWPSVVNVLSQIPADVGLVLFTTRGDRACGSIIRTANFHSDDWVREQIDEGLEERVLAPGPAAGAEQGDIDTVESQLNHLLQKIWCPVTEAKRHLSKGDTSKVSSRKSKANVPGSARAGTNSVEDLKIQIEVHSQGNPALARLLSQTLRYVCLPKIISRKHLDQNKPPSEHLKSSEVLDALANELASLTLPRPVTPYPEAVLDHVASFVLAELSGNDRQTLGALAKLTGPFSREHIESVSSDLFDRIEKREPMFVPFEWVGESDVDLYPEFRRMARPVSVDGIDGIHSDVLQRRLVLAQGPLLANESDDQNTTTVDSLFRTNLDRIDFGGGPFAWLLRDIFQPLYLSDEKPFSQAAMSLLNRLVELDDPAITTNITPLGRAKISYIYGRILHDAAGPDWGRRSKGVDFIRMSHWIAKRCWQLPYMLDPPDGLPGIHHLQPRDVWLLTLQGWRFARLREEGCWHTIFGLPAPRGPRDEYWRNRRHGAEQDWQALWDEDSFETDKAKRLISRLNDLYEKQTGDKRKYNPTEPYEKNTVALALRTRAFELMQNAILKENIRSSPLIEVDKAQIKEATRENAIGMCEEAAVWHSEGDAHKQAAMARLEQSLFHTGHEKRKNLVKKSRELLELNAARRELPPYYYLLVKYMGQAEPSHPKCVDLKKMFLSRGELYFAQLIDPYCKQYPELPS